MSVVIKGCRLGDLEEVTTLAVGSSSKTGEPVIIVQTRDSITVYDMYEEQDHE